MNDIRYCVDWSHADGIESCKRAENIRHHIAQQPAISTSDSGSDLGVLVSP